MELKYYTTEELKAELKRRNDLAKVEKEKIKRCRMCKHWGEINYFGSPNNGFGFGLNRCCRYKKTSQANITEHLVVISLLASILEKRR